MIATPTKSIPSDVLPILSSLAWDNGGCRITDQLDRKTYTRVNAVLESLGGAWNRKAKAHIFGEDGDGESAVREAVATGVYVDPVDLRKAFQFFETPRELVMQMINKVGGPDALLNARVLEPSAGNGAIADIASAVGAEVYCVELNPNSVGHSRCNGHDVRCCDFLDLRPQSDEDGPYDFVLMNPPFSRSQDIAHVRHAYDFLKPGGKLVAIMGAGWTFRSDRKAVEFREWLGEVGGEWEWNEDGAFRESGTMVRTVMVVIEKS